MRIVTTILDSQVEPRRKWKGYLCAKRHTDMDTLYCCNAASYQLASCKNLRFPRLHLRHCLAYAPVWKLKAPKWAICFFVLRIILHSRHLFFLPNLGYLTYKSNKWIWTQIQMGKPTFQEPWNYYGLPRQQCMHIIATGEEGGYLMKINGDMLLVVVDLAEASIEMQFLAKSDWQEFLSQRSR